MERYVIAKCSFWPSQGLRSLQHELASPFFPFLAVIGGIQGSKMHKQTDPLPILPREGNHADLGLGPGETLFTAQLG